MSSIVESSDGCTVIISDNSLCGSQVIINGPQGDRKCIFGGLLMVDGLLYGTTTRHWFDNRSNQNCNFLPTNMLSSPAKSNSSSIVPVRAIYRSFQAETTSEQLIQDYDWALLELKWDCRVSQNLMIAPNIVDGREITGAYSSSVNAGSEVSIALTGRTTRRGTLCTGHNSIIMNGLVLEARLITLDQQLPTGSSGAWVVLQDVVCGVIVATQPDLPWAYMIPIELVLKDIKQSLNAKIVRIPSPGEIREIFSNDVVEAPPHNLATLNNNKSP